jgi:hypothetical protein
LRQTRQTDESPIKNRERYWLAATNSPILEALLTDVFVSVVTMRKPGIAQALQ